MERAAQQLAAGLRQRYVALPFVGQELADIYAAACFVVGRAGAGTVAELAALGKPSILVPLPGSAGGEQEANARMLTDAGGSVLLPQDEMTAERLVATVDDLLQGGKLKAMSTAALSRGNADAARGLARALLDLAGRAEAN
jgi:UDP-N-acetylglucosamine--N-acetylmuramyl-(pentapeptide) pyrophosphoryl-undecaprenol N-acetylglucosamine transferase